EKIYRKALANMRVSFLCTKGQIRSRLIMKGDVNVNDLQDVQKIIDDYVVKGGQALTDAAEEGAAKQAEDIFTEGLAKLKALKLSPEDRYNFSLLRKTFECFIACAKSHQKKNHRKAIIQAQEGTMYAQRYTT